MPINVELWTELANPQIELGLEGLVLPDEVWTDARFDVLKWVDPYGDTVFNRAQCGRLIEELRYLGDRPSDVKLAHLRELAMRALGEVHTYLVFVGD